MPLDSVAVESLFTVLIDIVLGAVLGVVGGLFGIGGGLIAIPVLVLLFGLDQQLAQGTALVMVVPNVLLSVYRYNQRIRIDLQHAGLLAAAGMTSALVGATLAVSLDARSMRHGFVGFLLLLVAYNLWQLYRRGQPSLTTPSRSGLSLLGLVAGLVGGLFGVGGAVIATPILVGVMGMTQVAAQGMSLAMALPTTGVTLMSYAWHGEVDWRIGIPLALGGLLSVSWGVRLAHQLPERLLRLLFCGFLLLCAVLLALR